MATGTGSLSSADVHEDFAQKVAAYAHTLSMAQWLSPQELEASQIQLTFRLLQHARRTTPFYRDRLDMDFGSPAKIKERWRDIPILTRAQAIANRLKLISRKPPRDLGPVSEGMTSGSTGVPFVFKKNAAMDVVSTALNERSITPVFRRFRSVGFWSAILPANSIHRPSSQLISPPARKTP
jgi:phenylacetate-coenzyme A ligase PaaK-like adenylate-forming protein